jgi:F-type H+-transporting ATPase subunit b
MSLLYDSHFVVGLSFFLFFGLLAYLGVHKFLALKLDDRAERIRAELDEVRRLREDAQATFAEFERKQREVQGQADEIVAHAKLEAEQAAKIANAVREVRNRAVQVAVAAAAEVITSGLTADKADALIDNAIKSVGERLH